VRFALVGLLLASFAACAPSDAATSPIEIRIEHSRFRPQHIEVRAGEEVTFVIENTDPIGHEFIVGNEEIQQIHERGTEAHHDARPGEVSVPAGESVTTTYRFRASENLLFGCHLPGHYAYGMRGTISIG
jgi:uncharacterized cupredoxin-like copper-binding protein